MSNSTNTAVVPSSSTDGGTTLLTSSAPPAPTSAEPSTPSAAAPPPSTQQPTATSQAAPPPPPPVQPLTTTLAGPTTTAVTSVVITTISDGGANTAPTTVTLTSTSAPPTFRTSTFAPAPTPGASTRISTVVQPTPLPSPSSTTRPNSGGGLKNGGTIAVAVVVPVVSVALLVVGVLFFLKKRKQKRATADMRRKEVEEYGYNPNQDPTLPGAAAAVSGNGGEGPYDAKSDTGYRGWGAAPVPAARKPSTTLSSGTGPGPIGVALTDGTAATGYAATGPGTSPTHAPPMSETHSGEALLHGGGAHGPATDDAETIGELGGAPVASAKRDIRRGPSNASSSYSAANRSDASGEVSVPGGGGPHGGFYNNNNMGNNNNNDAVYDDAAFRQAGPYDGSYTVTPPIIREVQARRNTRIESPSIVPPPGNAGIAQNF